MKKHFFFALKTFLFLSIFVFSEASAENFKFKMGNPINVVVCRSSTAGEKMVKVTIYGKSADAAIKQAQVDAVASLTFWGAPGIDGMENCPPILTEGEAAYAANKKFFDKFLRKGLFLPYVRKVTSGYPTGKDNVMTRKGRRVQIYLFVNWQGLSEYYQRAGMKTAMSGLLDF